jgi:hypothetical protein
MATTQRSEYLDSAIRDLRINTATEVVPNQIAGNIQLTYELRPLIKLVIADLNNGTTTTPIAAIDAEVYIVAATLDVEKDVTSTSTASKITCTIDGKGQRILSIPTTTLTAQHFNQSVSIPYPGLKIDRNTAVNVTNTTGTANITATAVIYYYILSK